jgi:hypothetical protein
MSNARRAVRKKEIAVKRAEGRAAFEAGKTRQSCRLYHGGPDWLQWMIGYDEAAREAADMAAHEVEVPPNWEKS